MPVRTPKPYPTSDGKPFDSDWHRDLLAELIDTLSVWFAGQPRVYVSGWLMVFPHKGNKHRYVAPDVFVVKGVENHPRDNYLVWEEGRGPTVVIELTSSSTRREDTHRKFELYQNVLRVPEYFLFDPLGDYLDPRLQGHRLVGGHYQRMRLVGGRLRSRRLGLILEPDGEQLRLADAETRQRLPTRAEARLAVKAENERLRREIEELKRKQQEG